MLYLLVKTHNKTGKKYLCKTVKNNYHDYQGSGKYWKHHIKKHDYDVTTECIFQTEDKQELKEKGLYYSELWNIVESDEWANLKPESGDGGGIRGSRGPYSEEERLTAYASRRNRRRSYSEEEKLLKYASRRGPRGPQKNPNTRGPQKNPSKKPKKFTNHSTKQIVTCPHCNKNGPKPQMIQWHFDKCKSKK